MHRRCQPSVNIMGKLWDTYSHQGGVFTGQNVPMSKRPNAKTSRSQNVPSQKRPKVKTSQVKTSQVKTSQDKKSQVKTSQVKMSQCQNAPCQNVPESKCPKSKHPKCQNAPMLVYDKFVSYGLPTHYPETNVIEAYMTGWLVGLCCLMTPGLSKGFRVMYDCTFLKLANHQIRH